VLHNRSVEPRADQISQFRIIQPPSHSVAQARGGDLIRGEGIPTQLDLGRAAGRCCLPLGLGKFMLEDCNSARQMPQGRAPIRA
jgi:hypothetical protein